MDFYNSKMSFNKPLNNTTISKNTLKLDQSIGSNNA